MCLYINNSPNKPIPQVAAEDIYCYKILRVIGEGIEAVVVSPYQDFEYTPGKVHGTTRFKAEKAWSDGTWEINEGMHTFVTFDGAKLELEDWDSSNYYLFVCIIPKGAKYFIGEFNQEGDGYVSNKLILLRRDDPRSMAKVRNLPPNRNRYGN